MKYNQLGKTALKVSEIGFGGWAISGEGYGPTDDNESVKTLHNAIDNGINFIDTADSYGKGKSEALIGKVLSERKDKETIVATKFGWDFYVDGGIKGNLDPKYINFAVDQSLKRIKRDWIDIYQIHSQTPGNIIKLKVTETLEKLKKSGKIRYYGFSANYISDAIKLMELRSFDTLQIPFSLTFPEAKKKLFQHPGIDSLGIISREPIANGFLSGKYSIMSKFSKKDHRNGFSKEKKKEILKKVEKLKFLDKDNRSLIQTAVCYCIQNEKIDVTIPGIKNKEQLDEIIHSCDLKISPDEFNQIDKTQADWI